MLNLQHCVRSLVKQLPVLNRRQVRRWGNVFREGEEIQSEPMAIDRLNAKRAHAHNCQATAGSGALDHLVDSTRDCAKAWAHFARWCRMNSVEPLRPSPEMIGLNIADLAAPLSKGPLQATVRPLSVSTIEPRQSGFA